MNPSRLYLGDYFQGHFTKVTDPNGEMPGINPGDLSIAPLSFPFSYEHIQEAITAAKRAFTSWKRSPSFDRIKKFQNLKDIIRNKKDVISYWISFETGKPLWESNLEVENAIQLINYYLSLGCHTDVEHKVEKVFGESDGKIRFFPRGVMVILVPAYSPLTSPLSHLLPALMNGNTLIFKSSVNAPMTAQIIAECFHESGISPGVFNLIHGNSEVARRLVTHPEVDGVFYTGSQEAGVKIKQQLATSLGKHVVLEMGGKNSSLIWEDSDYPLAVYHTLLASFLTSGQRCTSTNRVIVHEKIFDTFLKDLHQLAKKLPIGYGLTEGDKTAFMGPLFTESAVEDYLRYLGIGVREGAEEIMRGKVIDKDKKGYYVSPSIFYVEKADSKSVYQKSEIYGPNIALFKVSDLDEAISLMNLPQTGLVASLYSKNREIYAKVSEEIRVGIFHWNLPTTHISYHLPLGGIKNSGNGRPMGSYAAYQCTYPMSVVESTQNPDILPSVLPRL